MSGHLRQYDEPAHVPGLDRYSGGSGDFVLVWHPLSCGFEADRADESVEVIDDTLIEAVELRSVLLVDSSIGADGAEKAGDKRRIDALEEASGRPDRLNIRAGGVDSGESLEAW